MGRIVKCAHCGAQVDKDYSVRYKDKNYHNKCYNIVYQRDELADYICTIFRLKKAGPRNYALIKKYVESGYTYYGIKNALKYFYEVQNHTTSKANESIGIVPYVYEEAQAYFEKIEKKQFEIKESLEKQTESNQVKIVVNAAPTRKKKQTLDLEKLIGGDND